MDIKYKSSFQSGCHMERRYQQALEEEQSSLARNKKLLEDIDRLEEQMKYFHDECKQDEDKLNRAKNKFMRYVKSVYPKWTEDLRKWHEAKKQPPNEDKLNDSVARPDLRSTSNRNHLSFTDSERSPSGSVPHKEDTHGGLLGFSKERMENPRDDVGYARQNIGHPRDIMGSYKDRLGFPKDTVESSRDTMGYSRDMKRYPSDSMVSSMVYSRDRLNYSRDKIGYSGDMMESSREPMEHSRDDIGFSRGTMDYPRNENGYPRDSMYNGRPWMYPQHSPPGMFPHTTHPYFLPMPTYGVPRWSTPGYMYDHWSNPHERSYHEDVGEHQRPQNVSFEKHENGQHLQQNREALANAGNRDLYPDQRISGDKKYFHKGFTDHLSVEDLLNDKRYPADHQRDTRRQYQDHSQGLGRSGQEIDSERITEGGERYEKNVDSRALPQRNVLDGSYVKKERENREVSPTSRTRGEDGELFEDRERDHGLEKMKRQRHREGEVNDLMPSHDNQIEEHPSGNIGDERNLRRGNKLDGGSFNEELTDHTTNSERFDSSKQNKSDGGNYVGEPRRETRLVQLRSDGSGFGAMDTDSVSFPTIHQYEGDIRDVFSDTSSSEPLSQNGSSHADVKPSKKGDTSQVRTTGSSKRRVESAGSSKSEPLNQNGSSHVDVKPSKKGGTSQVGTTGSSKRRVESAGSSKSEPLSQNGSSHADVKPSKKGDTSQVRTTGSSKKRVESAGSSKSEPLNQYGNSHADVKPSKNGDASHVGTTETSKKLLTRVASESRTSVVEDLIGDDVSDFEVSEAELSEDELGGREALSSTVVSGNVIGDSVTGYEVGDTSSGVQNETVVEDKRAGVSGLNESIAQHRQNDIQNEDLTGDNGAREDSLSHARMRQHEEAGENLRPARKETKDLGEVLEKRKDTDEEEDILDDFENFSHGDVSISEERPGALNTSSKRQTDTKAYVSKIETGIKDVENTERMKGENITERNGSINEENDSVLKEGLLPESREGTTAKEVKTGVEKESDVKNMIEDQSIEEEIVEDIHEDEGEHVSVDEKSRSGVLDEVSFSSGESSSESVPVQEKKASENSEAKTKESVSYSEDFEDERSIPLTQSAAYQKMLSTVDVSDEGEDIEDDFLQGTMSEANTTAQSTKNMPQTLQDSGTSSQVKLPAAKTSKSKPTLSLFSSGEGDDFANNFGKENNEGVLSASWKSSERSLSPPLSPDAGGYVPSVLGTVGDREVEKEKVSQVDEATAETGKTQAKPQESNTKSRIQAGFWNHSDSESEVDLQISHGGGGNDNNDDDDDFDFYS